MFGLIKKLKFVLTKGATWKPNEEQNNNKMCPKNERAREAKKNRRANSQRERGLWQSVFVCVCVLRSYVFALETLALDEPGREIESERERDEEEMVIGVSSVAD